MTIAKYPPPVKIDLPHQSNRKSNVIYKLFQHQCGVENLENRVAVLEAELEATKEALEERYRLLKIVEAEVTGIEEITE